MYDGLRGDMRTIKLRPKRPECLLCGENKEIEKLVDYVQFCGSGAHDKGMAHFNNFFQELIKTNMSIISYNLGVIKRRSLESHQKIKSSYAIRFSRICQVKRDIKSH